MAQVMAQSRNVEKHGPYGSQLTQNWEMKLGKNERITEVIVRHGYVVDSIGFVLADSRGGTTTKLFGGRGGDMSKITLKPGEYITQISGTHGEYQHMCNGRVIATLKIHTNLNPSGYGSYGRGQDCKNVGNFSSPHHSGHIVGFFGRHHNYLESIGVEMQKWAIERHGPYGSQNSLNWDVKLGASDTLKEVIVRSGFIVDAIGFKIADSNGNITTKMFGGPYGSESKIVLAPGEYLTHFSGSHGEYIHISNIRVLSSLKIHTNLRPSGYGPYGLTRDCRNVGSFTTPIPSGRIVGLFGRSGLYLDSIGVEIEMEPKN